MRYLRFRRRGFPIGSGRIEAAVKQVLNLRLKRNGAWWSVPNAEAILALRAAKLYGAFDEVWQRRLFKRCAGIPAALRTFVATISEPKFRAA
ncbi:MAG: hypothetical protein HY716_05690 [Planctomycetes bacterium]|nr:hypothetical protein [Planctomycetota bacterium]